MSLFQIVDPSTFPVMSLETEKDLARSPSDAKSEVLDFRSQDLNNISPPLQLSEAEEKKLWRKIDLKLLPILTLLYLLSFMDRGNVPVRFGWAGWVSEDGTTP